MGRKEQIPVDLTWQVKCGAILTHFLCWPSSQPTSTRHQETLLSHLEMKHANVKQGPHPSKEYIWQEMELCKFLSDKCLVTLSAGIAKNLHCKTRHVRIIIENSLNISYIMLFGWPLNIFMSPWKLWQNSRWVLFGENIRTQRTDWADEIMIIPGNSEFSNPSNNGTAPPHERAQLKDLKWKISWMNI